LLLAVALHTNSAQLRWRIVKQNSSSTDAIIPICLKETQRMSPDLHPHSSEADTFHLWVFSDAHVATDRAVSAAIRNGMGFIPPAGYPESLAAALRQSEEGGELGGPSFR